MAWNSLVAGATGEGNQGPRLRIEFLETENEALSAELRDLKLSRDNLLQSVSDQERIRVSLQRELTKLKGNLKYEKTAREGSSKRSAGYELECVSLRDERNALATEQKINRRRVEELSRALSQERMKRLRDLHLNEVLRKQNVALEESVRLVAADSVSANEKLLDKVLVADSAVAKSEVQRKIIDSQALEILSVTQETTVAQEKYKQAQEKIGEMEIALAKRTKEVLDFEMEIWRLRREVTALAGSSHSQQHVAFGRSCEPHSSFSLPTRRIRNEAELHSLSDDIRTRTGADLQSATGSLSSAGSAFGQERSERKTSRHVPESNVSLLSASLSGGAPSRSRGGKTFTDAVHSGAPPFSPGASSVFPRTTPYSPSRRGGRRADEGGLNKSSSEANIYLSKVALDLGGGDSLDSSQRAATKSNDRSNKLSTRPRSIYVGQGLGMRQDEEPAFDPKGSAKLILRDILRQHELENS